VALRHVPDGFASFSGHVATVECKGNLGRGRRGHGGLACALQGHSTEGIIGLVQSPIEERALGTPSGIYHSPQAGIPRSNRLRAILAMSGIPEPGPLAGGRCNWVSPLSPSRRFPGWFGAGFSDVGMRDCVAGSGRRPKSAQARNRGQNGLRRCGWLYGDLRLAATSSVTRAGRCIDRFCIVKARVQAKRYAQRAVCRLTATW
jgi:hypothetical protein